MFESAASVWLVAGVPTRMVWRGQRFRVDDRPTRISASDVLLHPALTHLPEWMGWRFQARGDDGLARVFDVRELPDHRWCVLASYA